MQNAETLGPEKKGAKKAKIFNPFQNTNTKLLTHLTSNANKWFSSYKARKVREGKRTQPQIHIKHTHLG